MDQDLDIVHMSRELRKIQVYVRLVTPRQVDKKVGLLVYIDYIRFRSFSNSISALSSLRPGLHAAER